MAEQLDFLSFLQEATQRANNAGGAISSNLGSIIEVSNEQEQLGAAVAEGQSAAAQQKNVAAFQAQENAKKLASAFGGNFNDSATEVMSQLGAEFRAGATAAGDLRKQYGELDAVTFFDNPLVWIGNQIKKDQVAAEYNSASDIASSAALRLQQLNNMVTGGAAAQKAISDGITADSLAKQNEAVATQAKFIANELRIKTIGTMVDANKALITNDKTQLDMLAQEQQYYNNQAVRAEARERLALMRMQKQQLHEARISAAADKDQLRELELQQATDTAMAAIAGAATLNIDLGQVLQPGADGNYEPKQVKQFVDNITKTAAGKAKWETWVALGINASSSVMESPDGHTVPAPIMFGNDSFDALRTVSLAGNTNNIPYAETASLLNDKLEQLEASKEFQLIKDKGAKEATIRERLSSVHKDWLTNAEAPDSLYKSPGIQAIYQSFPVASSAAPAFWQMLEPHAAVSLPDTFENITKLAYAAVERGELDPNAADVGITEYYKHVAAHNNINKGFTQYDIKPQVGYAVKSRVMGAPVGEGDIMQPIFGFPGKLSEPVAIDATKLEDVKKYSLLRRNRKLF